MHGSVGVLRMHCLCIMTDEIDSHSYNLKQIDNIRLCLSVMELWELPAETIRDEIIRLSYVNFDKHLGSFILRPWS